MDDPTLTADAFPRELAGRIMDLAHAGYLAKDDADELAALLRAEIDRRIEAFIRQWMARAVAAADALVTR